MENKKKFRCSGLVWMSCSLLSSTSYVFERGFDGRFRCALGTPNLACSPDALEEHHSTCDGSQGHPSWFMRQSGDRRSDLGNHGKNVLFAALPSTQEDQKVPLLVAQVHSQRVLPRELGFQIMYLDDEALALEFVLLAKSRELRRVGDAFMSVQGSLRSFKLLMQQPQLRPRLLPLAQGRLELLPRSLGLFASATSLHLAFRIAPL